MESVNLVKSLKGVDSLYFHLSKHATMACFSAAYDAANADRVILAAEIALKSFLDAAYSIMNYVEIVEFCRKLSTPTIGLAATCHLPIDIVREISPAGYRSKAQGRWQEQISLPLTKVMNARNITAHRHIIGVRFHTPAAGAPYLCSDELNDALSGSRDKKLDVVLRGLLSQITAGLQHFLDQHRDAPAHLPSVPVPPQLLP